MNKLMQTQENEIEENTSCAVCLDIDNKIMIKFACSHSYHKDCIVEWLKSNKTCPICREEMEIK